jgi:hypothetical protein
MVWTNLGGGDHEGQDWTPDSGEVLAGTHYNVATVNISNISIQAESPLLIYAEEINITGTVNGGGKGYAGGVYPSAGSGPGGGASFISSQDGAGGGGYGGAGNGSGGGSAYGDNNLPHIQMGSGGGALDTIDGEAGGGAIGIIADSITISGTLDFGGDAAGAGGGAGGGVFILGNTVNLDGATIDASGGNSSGNGGGGGGRIKIFYFTSLSTTGTTYDVTGGTGDDGFNGYDGTNYNEKLGQVNSTHTVGQTFTLDTGFSSGILSIDLYVKAVTTSGTVTVTIYDSTSKSVTYGSKSQTVSATGVNNFEFASIFQLPAADTEYYVEVTSSAADIQVGMNGYDDSLGGVLYYQDYDITGLEMYMVLYGYSHVKGPTILNTADTTKQCQIANAILSGATYKINRDGTGYIQYADDLTTEKYLSDAYDISGVTYDSVNDELDVADDGYIEWSIDTKYPVAGIPTFTAQIEVTAGAPTIQISEDGSEWFDIDTGIVNDTETEYQLISTNNLSLKGRTVLWVRLDCTGTSTNTCTVKSIGFHTDMVTVHAQLPEIVKDTSNTFRLDQDTGSAIACTITLDWRDRKLM